jgi:hypothetical protein
MTAAFAALRRSPAAATAVGLPAAAVAFFAFNQGGFFADEPALVALVLVGALVLRITLAERPLSGMSPGLAVAVSALAAFAVWALASSAWSGAPGRALPEYGRALAYTLAIAVVGLSGRTPRRLAWATRLLLAVIVVASAAGMLTRLLPGLVGAHPGLLPDRLSFPLTYWNGLGIFAAAGAVLGFGLTCSEREPRAVRILAAAALPVLTITVLLTFSRGAIAAGAVGMVLVLAAGRPAGWIGGIAATVLGCAPPLVAALRTDTLVTAGYAGAAGRIEGRHVAWIVLGGIALAALVRAAALPADTWASRRRALRRPRSAAERFGIGAVALVVAAVVAVAAGAPGFVSHQYDRFVEGNTTITADQRDRLLLVGNNGRVDNWRVGIDAFSSSPLHGRGAGTYQTAWTRERRIDMDVVDGHSLYVEVLAELGIVGLVLLLAALGTLLWGFARLSRGPDRMVPATLLAATAAWALHAGLDWDWEMPATGFGLLALGGLALAAPASPARGRPLPRLARVVAALACLLLALTPLSLLRGQRAEEAAVSAFQAGDCRTAVDRALASIEANGSAGVAREVLGYCDVRLGAPRLAEASLQAAVERDREYWVPWYGLAMVRAAIGEDPRPALARAGRLNPREPLVRDAARAFERSAPRRWPEVAGTRRLPLR